MLLGKKIDFDDVEKHIRNGEKVIFTVEGWDGPVAIECDTLELLSYVKAFREIRQNETSNQFYGSGDPIYDVYLAYHFAFGEMEIDFAQLPKSGKASLIGDECDQFSVHSVRDMEEFLDEDLEKVKEKALEYQNEGLI